MSQLEATRTAVCDGTRGHCTPTLELLNTWRNTWTLDLARGPLAVGCPALPVAAGPSNCQRCQSRWTVTASGTAPQSRCHRATAAGVWYVKLDVLTLLCDRCFIRGRPNTWKLTGSHWQPAEPHHWALGLTWPRHSLTELSPSWAPAEACPRAPSRNVGRSLRPQRQESCSALRCLCGSSISISTMSGIAAACTASCLASRIPSWPAGSIPGSDQPAQPLRAQGWLQCVGSRTAH